MAEEKDIHGLTEGVLSRDDMSALTYVLQTRWKDLAQSSATKLSLELEELDETA